MTEATWSVVTIAREPASVIRRFVAWHLDAGAAKVTIFFDDPSDPAIGMVAGLGRVEAIPCTAEFWRKLGADPETHFTRRQKRACLAGYKAAPDGWVLNIDADELLLVQGRSVAAFLAAQPADCRSVLVEPAERVWVAGDERAEVFRLKQPPDIIRELHGDFADFMLRGQGMVGHTIGKSILRTGLHAIRGFHLRQHSWQIGWGEMIADARAGPKEGTLILHFHSSGYDDWRRKLDYRLVHGAGLRPKLRALLAAALANGDEDRIREVYAHLHSLDDRQARILGQAGLMKVADLDLDRKVAAHFPVAASTSQEPD